MVKKKDNVPFAIDWFYSNDDVLGLPGQRETIKRTIFESAANRWKNAIKEWPVSSKLRINVKFEHFTGANRDAAARVEPNSLKHTKRAAGFKLPAEGTITIDLADKNALLRRRGEFLDVVTHEIGHVLGIGILLEASGKSLVKQRSNGDWVYVGERALEQYKYLGGQPVDGGVPIAFEGSGSERAFHWDDKYLQWELMSANLEAPQLGGALGPGLNAISCVTIGALADLGHDVDMAGAEFFQLRPPP